MSWEEFLQDATKLLEVSDEILDDWSLRGDAAAFGQRYLAKREVREGPTLWEFHVLYSSSYAVPTLYLYACFSDGRPLSQEQVWAATRLEGDVWSVLTQKEHPFLRRPFFQLHPCHTAELLRPFSSGNLLVTWLSSIGPAVGLRLPLAYARLCRRTGGD